MEEEEMNSTANTNRNWITMAENSRLRTVTILPPTEESVICDVWNYNLEQAFQSIRKVVKDFQYIAMDTEFPGVVWNPQGEFREENQYMILKRNVDMLKLIQLGMSFLNEDGKTPPGCSTWQFNFKFDLGADRFAENSMDILRKSGIQFDKHREIGIDPSDFADLLTSSGIVLFDNIKWICYQSSYDFGYLIKILTGSHLPRMESDFFEILAIYCPVIYDIKYLTMSNKTIRGGLQDLANLLSVKRIGTRHQAGSDALVTGLAYFKLREERRDIRIFNCVDKIIFSFYVNRVPLFVAPNVDISKYRYK